MKVATVNAKQSGAFTKICMAADDMHLNIIILTVKKSPYK